MGYWVRVMQLSSGHLLLSGDGLGFWFWSKPKGQSDHVTARAGE